MPLAQKLTSLPSLAFLRDASAQTRIALDILCRNIALVFELRPGILVVPLCVSAWGQTARSTSGIDLGAMDTSVSPCTNFYQYACGTWRVQNPIPPDKSRWGRFDELSERNLTVERDILEKAARLSGSRSALDRQIGDYYASCMGEQAIEQKGIAAIQPELDAINALSSKDMLAGETARLNLAGIDVFFNFSSEPDLKNAAVNIAGFDQGGISLPDRDYYLKNDARSQDIRTKYQQHVANMFDLLSKSLNISWDSKAKAASLLKFETALATISLDRVARRDPDNLYHPMQIDDLSGMAPNFDWKLFVQRESPPAFTKINVGVPDFFHGLRPVIADTSLDDIKTYLTWRLLLSSAGSLPKAYVDENFDFWGKTLSGAKELEARWKRCTRSVDRALGEALGQKFIEVAFSGPAKEKALQLVREIEQSMKQDIETASWMSDATKQQALAKLTVVSNKIGYPDHFRDYSSIKIARDDFMGNRQRAYAFEVHRELNKIGKPVDKTEWGMTPPTVNAYYNPPENNINFPAGILQPPFYSAAASDAVNYGAIGVVVGHELTHGFDDEGRKFDGGGNLRDWWTPEDAKNFEQRAECISSEYSKFSPVDGVNLNGKLTLGENAADNGGIHLAYTALMRELGEKTLPKKVDGFTSEQLFFLGYAQVWCQNVTDAAARRMAITDPHSPGQFRVNGVVQNLKEFQDAFSCKIGDPMVSQAACRVW